MHAARSGVQKQPITTGDGHHAGGFQNHFRAVRETQFDGPGNQRVFMSEFHASSRRGEELTKQPGSRSLNQNDRICFTVDLFRAFRRLRIGEWECGAAVPGNRISWTLKKCQKSDQEQAGSDRRGPDGDVPPAGLSVMPPARFVGTPCPRSVRVHPNPAIL